MDGSPYTSTERRVPVQAADGVMVEFTVRELEAGDLMKAGVADAFARIVESIVLGGAAREAISSRASLAPFVAPFGDYARCLSACAAANPNAARHAVRGREWRVEDLKLAALSPLVNAFNELHFAEGKVEGLAAALGTIHPVLGALTRRAVSKESASGTPPSRPSTSSSRPDGRSTSPSGAPPDG